MDALTLAGDVAAQLEEYGVTACGRTQDGETRIDFWTHNGKGHRCAVQGSEDAVVLLYTCLQIAGISATPRTAATRWS